MEFSKEFIEEQKFTPEQVTALGTSITTHYDAKIADLKGEWDGVADKNANAILDGAAKAVFTTTNVTRDQGEKVADYISRSWDVFNKTKTSELKTRLTELDDKIKGAGTDPVLKAELEKIQGLYSELQKKEAQFDELNGSGIKDKYNALKETNSTLTEGVAFGSVKPNFPETTNSYEASTKWDNFKKKTLKTNTLEQVDGEWLAIDKENNHKQAKLSDLVSKDTELAELVKGRQQPGPGATPIRLETIEGVPFEVTDIAVKDPKKRQELIQDYLLNVKKFPKLSSEYSEQFGILNDKIRNAVVAA